MRISVRKPPKIEDLKETLTKEEIEASGAAVTRKSEELIGIKATSSKKGVFSFTLPDLSRVFGTVEAEAGVHTLEGVGTVKINFEYSFSDNPFLITTPFGYWEIQIPLPGITYKTFNIGYWRIDIPVPYIDYGIIRLPSLAFVMNVSTSGFEVMHFGTRTVLSYFALG